MLDAPVTGGAVCLRRFILEESGRIHGELVEAVTKIGKGYIGNIGAVDIRVKTAHSVPTGEALSAEKSPMGQVCKGVIQIRGLRGYKRAGAFFMPERHVRKII